MTDWFVGWFAEVDEFGLSKESSPTMSKGRKKGNILSQNAELSTDVILDTKSK